MNSIKYECPHCHRPVYNRALPKCGYCEGALPQEFLFSEEELVKLRKEQETLEQERQNLRRRIRESEKEKRNGWNFEGAA